MYNVLITTCGCEGGLWRLLSPGSLGFQVAWDFRLALVQTMRKTGTPMVDRGVKMAPFVVLVATEMPAILAEVSCLSNVDEAKRLSEPEYRQAIAEALASGMGTFAKETRLNAAERRRTSGS